jgi:site-specific DNA-methyltransferase (adenine-specific)
MKITNEDCIELMSRYEDNYFDLAIVDPPYGIDDKLYRSSYGNCVGSLTKYAKNRWDKHKPNKNYFNELFRVSKNQIIWGANYFLDYLPSTRGIICWDKDKYVPNFSAWEMAWTSFDCVARLYKKININPKKIHPTQKPVKLYEWLLMKYAKEGHKILDTHLGSGSIAIACHNLGYDLTACEIDEEYYNNAVKRIKQHTSQKRLF